MTTGQMHPGTRRIDNDLVRRLIAGQFPQWAGLAVKRFPSGGTVNAMYRLGNDMVVRLPLVKGGANDVAVERTWLPRLAPHLPTPIPEVLGDGQPAEGYPWPWSVYQWLTGENPEAGVLSEPVLLAEDLAEFVAAMRSITLPGAPQAHRGAARVLTRGTSSTAAGEHSDPDGREQAAARETKRDIPNPSPGEIDSCSLRGVRKVAHRDPTAHGKPLVSG